MIGIGGWSAYEYDYQYSDGMQRGFTLIPAAVLILWGLLNELRTRPTSYGLWLGGFLGLTMVATGELVLLLEMDALRSTVDPPSAGPGFYGFAAAGLLAVIGVFALLPVLRARTARHE